MDSLLVLTGVTTAAQLVAARPEHRPTYVAEDLRGLLEAQPVVSDGFGCGGWTASVGDGALVLEGAGERIDGLRALCAAAWDLAGEGVCALDAGKALARLGW